MTAILLTHYCRDCRHQWPGHRIPCDLHEPFAFQGPGFAGCADHELAAQEQEEDAGLWWLAGVSVLVFWTVVALLVVWLWQRGL